MRVLQAGTKTFEFKSCPEGDLMHSIGVFGKGFEDTDRELGEFGMQGLNGGVVLPNRNLAWSVIEHKLTSQAYGSISTPEHLETLIVAFPILLALVLEDE